MTDTSNDDAKEKLHADLFVLGSSQTKIICTPDLEEIANQASAGSNFIPEKQNYLV